jgi:DNA helicase-2/ATP-dependent DNA helicase PcrA
MEEGIFPGYKSMDNPQDLEEERRLFYVGITRAKQSLFLSFAKKRTIFGSTSYNPPSRFVKEIPKDLLDGYEDAMQTKSKEDEFEDSGFGWSYSKSGLGNSYSSKYSNANGKVTSYKSNESNNIGDTSENKYNYRSAENFLASIESKKNSAVDISKYKEGQKVYHKKFGEGTITKVEQEGDDCKVDIEFAKVGHKRLMAKFAGLEVLE